MDFETRYNAMEHAKLIMIQRLLMEVAAIKGNEANQFIDAFRNACITEISDTTVEAGSQRPLEISKIAKSIVEGVAEMAKDRLQQRKDEGNL
jgi:hypothetical protein